MGWHGEDLSDDKASDDDNFEHDDIGDDADGVSESYDIFMRSIFFSL